MTSPLSRQAPSGPIITPSILELTVDNSFNFGPEDNVVYDNFPAESLAFSIDETNTQITFKKSGKYRIDVRMLATNSNASNESAGFFARKNGESILYVAGVLNAATWMLATGMKVLDFAAGDIFNMGIDEGITNSITNRSNAFQPVLLITEL